MFRCRNVIFDPPLKSVTKRCFIPHFIDAACTKIRGEKSKENLSGTSDSFSFDYIALLMPQNSFMCYVSFFVCVTTDRSISFCAICFIWNFNFQNTLGVVQGRKNVWFPHSWYLSVSDPRRVFFLNATFPIVSPLNVPAISSSDNYFENPVRFRILGGAFCCMLGSTVAFNFMAKEGARKALENTFSECLRQWGSGSHSGWIIRRDVIYGPNPHPNSHPNPRRVLFHAWGTKRFHYVAMAVVGIASMAYCSIAEKSVGQSGGFQQWLSANVRFNFDKLLVALVNGK